MDILSAKFACAVLIPLAKHLDLIAFASGRAMRPGCHGLARMAVLGGTFSFIWNSG